MIGQKELINRIDYQVRADLFPRFAIFIGNKGSGKKTLMREFAHKHWKFVVELDDVRVDTIRKMIEEAYFITSPTVYIISDAQKMSVNARNALLKITEEPPNKATFLMSATDAEQVLETIRSRGTTFYMRPYSSEDKLDYLDTVGSSLDTDVRHLIMQVCSNLSEIDLLLKSSPGELYDYADKLISNLTNVSVANMLKTSKNIAFKDGSDGYDLELLWKVCCFNMRNRIDDEPDKGKLYADLISETLSRMADLIMPSVSKSNTYDLWLLNCRKLIHKYEDSSDGDKSTETTA